MTLRLPWPHRRSRAPGWEYLLFAAELEKGLRRVKGSRGPRVFRTGSRISAPSALEALRLLPTYSERLEQRMESFTASFSDQRAFEAAFGAPGTPGNASAIRRRARELSDFHRFLIDWKQGLLDASGPTYVRNVLAQVATLADRPLQEVESFAHHSAQSIRTAVAAARAGTSTNQTLSLTLTLSADEAASRAARGACALLGQQAAAEAKQLQVPRRRKPIPESVRNAVWRRDDGRCAKCGSRQFLEYDHIVPFSKGGSDTERNLELLCQACNRRKGARI